MFPSSHLTKYLKLGMIRLGLIMNYTLKIENDYCNLLTEDSVLKTKLWQALRVRPKNYFHSPAFKKKVWDGYVDFFKLNTGRFLTGLLPDVKNYLDALKIECNIQDGRTKPVWTNATVGKDFLNTKSKKIEMYDYQVSAINQIVKWGRGIVQLPTAAGKTLCLISALKLIPPKTPVLFLTKNKGLVNQNYNNMMEWGIPNVGRWYDKYKELNYIMCATAHKATFKSLEKLLPLFKAIFVDEVHECMSDLCEKVYPKLTNATVRIGISATPFKFDGKDKEHKFKIKGHFGPVFKTGEDNNVITTSDLQERGMLSKSGGVFYNITTPTTIKHEPYLDAVTMGIAENFEFLAIVKKLVSTLSGRTLILVERKAQGEYLKQLIPHAQWIQGKDKLEIREEVFESLRSDSNAVAIATRHIITAGIDVFIHNLINAAGGQAEHSVVQQMGRGLRRAGDKVVLKYIDFIFRTNDYLEDHSENRVKTLTKEGHDIVVKDIDF